MTKRVIKNSSGPKKRFKGTKRSGNPHGSNRGKISPFEGSFTPPKPIICPAPTYDPDKMARDWTKVSGGKRK